MFGYGVWWIQVSVHQFGLPLYTFSISVTAALIIIQAAHLILFGLMIHGFLQPRMKRAALLAIPAVWVLIEFLRSWFASGFPWLLLGYAHTESILAGFAPLGSAYLVSYFAVLIAVALAIIVEQRDVMIVVCVLVILGLGIGLTKYPWNDDKKNTPLRVTLVQGAVPQEIKWHPDVRQASIDLYRQLSEPHWGNDVIIWPETAIPAYADEVPEVLSDLQTRADAAHAELLLGMATRAAENPTNERRPYFNSLIRIGGNGAQQTGSITARYDKRHLVPFGEYMPFDKILRPITNLLNVPMSDFSRGASDNATIRSGEMVFGTSICYEDAYAELLRDALPAANVLVNISNDAWFGATIAPHQHLQISQMRALELGRYMLRATNTGISAVINERGEIVAKSKQFKPEALSAEFELLSGLTPFARFGSMPIFAWCLVSFAILCARTRRAL